jgi:hypothetical protein
MGPKPAYKINFLFGLWRGVFFLLWQVVAELQPLAAGVGSKISTARAATVAATFLGWAWLHSRHVRGCSVPRVPEKGYQSAIYPWGSKWKAHFTAAAAGGDGSNN